MDLIDVLSLTAGGIALAKDGYAFWLRNQERIVGPSTAIPEIRQIVRSAAGCCGKPAYWSGKS